MCGKMPVRGGYCFEWTGEPDAWRAGDDDEPWDTVIYTPKGGEIVVALMRIDGHPMTVFQCEDGKFRAINDSSVVPEPLDE